MDKTSLSKRPEAPAARNQNNDSALRLARSVVAYLFRMHLKRDITEGENVDRHAQGVLKSGLTIDQYERAIMNSEEYRLREKQSKSREVVEFRGCRFNLPTLSPLLGQLKLPEGYESWVLPDFMAMCRPGMYVVDVGANWGVYSLPVSRIVGDAGRVWAFEANGKNAEFILDAIDLNACTNVQLVPAAVGEAFGHAIMPDNEATNAGEVLFDRKAKGHVIPVVPLDAVLADVPRIDLIKMDIEGSEFRALKGARTIIDKFRPIVFLEFCPVLLKQDTRPLIEFFLDRDYEITVFPHNASRRDMTGSRKGIIDELVAMCAPPTTLVDLRFVPRAGQP